MKLKNSSVKKKPDPKSIRIKKMMNKIDKREN
jgi:hypothetical protein